MGTYRNKFVNNRGKSFANKLLQHFVIIQKIIKIKRLALTKHRQKLKNMNKRVTFSVISVFITAFFVHK